MKKIPFIPADILLPKATNMNKWSVVACDQYTSEPDYWNRVESYTDNSLSTFNLILPEIYLESEDCALRIENIHKTMNDYLNNDIFESYNNSFIYVERRLLNGTVRKGIIGAIDLEEYDYSKDSKSLIRATEGTVISRIPPRLKVRNGASLELPHILILINDEEKMIIESIEKNNLKKLYDFELMENGGKIEGYLIDDVEAISESFSTLFGKLNPENPLLFAVGDGNHSLATAKAYWENIKSQLSDDEKKIHPARYALAEIGNLHDESLIFEPIHRIIFNCERADLISELKNFYEVSETDGEQYFEIVEDGNKQKIYITNPKSNLSVGSLQLFLDDYIKKHDTITIDYIHGENVVSELSKNENNLGFLLPAMDKSELFKTVIKDGALPRKTFSMGEASEKRYYLEARKIV